MSGLHPRALEWKGYQALKYFSFLLWGLLDGVYENWGQAQCEVEVRCVDTELRRESKTQVT